jgi:transcription initiation factor TFIID subunit 1
MPHATMEGEPDPYAAQAQPTEDEDEFAKLMASATGPENTAGGGNFLDELNDRELDIGEKANNAVDYGDIELSDEDDLPDEEPVFGDEHDLQFSGSTLQDTGGDDMDMLDAELFGGGSSPVAERSHYENGAIASFEKHSADAAASLREAGEKTQSNFRPVVYTQEEEEVDPDYLEQMRLFGLAKRDGQHEDGPLPAPQTSQEYFDRIWPNFERGKAPRFYSLLPRKRAFFVPKQPLKVPKPIQLNKVSLDIAGDQEKSFRLPFAGTTTKEARQVEEHARGQIFINDDGEYVDESKQAKVEEEVELEDLGNVDDDEPIGNVSWNDLKIACEDWEAPSLETLSDDEDLMITPPASFTEDNDWLRDLGAHPPKKRKLDESSSIPQFSVFDQLSFPTWEDPEAATAEISKKIILDMNDPYLLLDVQLAGADQKKLRSSGQGLKRDNRGSLANPMFKRYNISNDEAYDALKENNQQKIRSTLSTMNVEHSLPALKLQYPFYKVNLSDRELRLFHRPIITFKAGERVSVEAYKQGIKRKHKKNLKPSEAFAVSEDLNVGDSSDLLLAEYSEEYPTTLSNFGMGNKIVNYYRRKDNEDTSRPKHELGETAVLLPQDKSPFSIFGQVPPGETVPTLHNAMYRAPVFQHTPKQTDFLVSRSHTGVRGSHYFMRNIQNLVVVGQEFPSVEVPGTHARKVTEASKKRLKMLAFRLYRRGQQRGARQPWVSNEMIKHHLPGTEIAQNRSRMREIMKYEKDTGTWRPQDGEVIPDEPSLRTWIKPEDICLIDSMHAGDKRLADAGFKANEIEKNEEDGDAGDNLELKLAPWHTTKNFQNACQGKAMLELHGAGDPTGRGEAFSFIKISMKGGFRDVGESVGDLLKSKKELNGHSYNVAHQQKRYEDAIQRIWNKQADSLSSKLEHSDVEMDGIDGPSNSARGRTPRSEFGTPAMHRDDDTMSQFSRNSGNDIRGKKLRIKRLIKNRYDEFEEQVITVTDPDVIKLYTKRKKQEQLENMRIEEMKATGNAEMDAQMRQKLEMELARLKRNVERREGREKAKGIHHTQLSTPGTPAAGTGKGGATPRKCANCGEVGHIKTNKKFVLSFLNPPFYTFQSMLT